MLLSSFYGTATCKAFGVTMLWVRFLLRKEFLSTTGLPYAFTDGYMKEEESNVKGTQFLLGVKKPHSELGSAFPG